MFPNVGRRYTGLPQVVDQIGIADGRFTRAQAERHVANHEAACFLPFEAACAIRESAFCGRERPHRTVPAVVGRYVINRGRDLLPIGANVLDRSAADRPGNSGQAFDARHATLDTLSDGRVPRFAGADLEKCPVSTTRPVTALNVDAHDEPIKSFVGNDHIAAATQHQ